MYSEDEISLMAERIKTGIPDSEVWLFGSYAWGRPRTSSDVDLALVVPDNTPEAQLAGSNVKARVLSRHGNIPIDVVVYRHFRFIELPQGTLAYEIRTKGRKL